MKKIFSPKQKATVALEAIKGIKTTNQLSSHYEVHPTQVGLWKKALIEHAETKIITKIIKKLKSRIIIKTHNRHFVTIYVYDKNCLDKWDHLT